MGTDGEIINWVWMRSPPPPLHPPRVFCLSPSQMLGAPPNKGRDEGNKEEEEGPCCHPTDREMSLSRLPNSALPASSASFSSLSGHKSERDWLLGREKWESDCCLPHPKRTQGLFIAHRRGTRGGKAID